MSVDAIFCTSTFYTLQALKVLVKPQFGQKSAEKLLKDILDYEARYIEKLSIMLFDYSALVCYGEMRHAADKTTHYIPGIRQGGDRNGSYIEATNFNPMNILRLAEKQFGDYEWGSSFGGKKWANIAHVSQKKGRIDDLIFCDTCFSLSHNNSPYVNKDEAKIFKLGDCDAYKRFLDIKFSCEPEIIIEYALPKLNMNVLRFVCRARTLGFIKKSMYISFGFDDYYHQKYEDFVFSYIPIKWGNNFLPNIFVESHKYVREDKHHDSDDERECREKIIKSGYDCEHTTIKIGDTVEITEAGKNYCNNPDVVPGLKGIVKYFDPYNDHVGVEFPSKIAKGHSLDGHCKHGYGWSFAVNMVKKSEPVKKVLPTVENFKIGDEVEVNEFGRHYDDNSDIHVGKKGIVKGFCGSLIGVDFQCTFSKSHNLNCQINTNTGWFLPAKGLNKIAKEQQEESISDKFQIGDKVEIISTRLLWNKNIEVGIKGIIKSIDSSSIGIEFFKEIKGHNLDGTCKNGYVWYIENGKNTNKIIKKSEDAA